MFSFKIGNLRVLYSLMFTFEQIVIDYDDKVWARMNFAQISLKKILYYESQPYWLQNYQFYLVLTKIVEVYY